MTRDPEISVDCDECGGALWAGGYCPECGEWWEDYR